MKIDYVVASKDNADALADLRVEAMRPSLLAIGRFDPVRARQRFLDSFCAHETIVLRKGKETIGFYVLRERPAELYLDHLYIHPEFQRTGVGRSVMKYIIGHGVSTRKPIKLIALKGSPANQFYISLDFYLVKEDEFDNHYLWDPDTHDNVVQPAYWSGVFAMSLCVFALVASEFMPVSLLTPISTDLQITEGMAGQGIAISGVFAVLTSLSNSALAGTLDRKKLLLVLTVLMGVSGAIVALAPNYLTYMTGRALIGVVIGGFWSMSAAMAIRLVPSNQVPKALASLTIS